MICTWIRHDVPGESVCATDGASAGRSRIELYYTHKERIALTVLLGHARSGEI